MMSKLCIRAILPVTMAVTGFVIICCLLLYSMIREDLVRDTVEHSTTLANTIVKSTRYAMLNDDRSTLTNLISNVGEQQGVKHVRIFNKKGLIAFSTDQREVSRYVDKNTAGCIACHSDDGAPRSTLDDMKQARSFTNSHGDKVLAVTVAIDNAPDCVNAACHVHREDQQLLGILDVGLDQAPLQKTLSALRVRMTLFTVMILCLTIGGVSAWLCWAIFQPIKTLTEFASRSANGEDVQPMPEIAGELGQLAEYVRQIDNRRQAAEQSPSGMKNGS